MTLPTLAGVLVLGAGGLWMAFEIAVNVVTPPPSRLPSEPSGADAKMLVKDNAVAVLNAGTAHRLVVHSSTPKERDP